MQSILLRSPVLACALVLLAASPFAQVASSEEAEEQGLIVEAPAAVQAPLGGVVHDGAALRSSDFVLLIPNTTGRRISAFHHDTGELIMDTYVHYDPDFQGIPIGIQPNFTNDGFYVSSQAGATGNVVYEYDDEGNFVGIFAPAGGHNPAIMENVRGIVYTPDGQHLAVAVAGGDNAHSIALFNSAGQFVEYLVAPGAGGLSNPWGILFRDNDILVTSSGASGILRYDLNGQFLDMFATGLNFPQQIIEAANGNVIAINSSPTATRGIYEFEPDGTPVHSHILGFTSPRGVHELQNGNLLVSSSGGVHEINRQTGETVAEVYEGGLHRFIGVVPAGVVSLPTDPELELAEYWAFNNPALMGRSERDNHPWPQPINSDFGDGHITYNFVEDYIVTFAGTTINAQFDDPAGQSFVVQVGTGLVNNGRYFDLHFSSVGLEDLHLAYATRGTSTGFDTQTLEFSVDGGTSWTDIGQVEDTNVTDFFLVEFDLSGHEALNNQNDVIIRVTVTGATGETGNNRFDNVTIHGVDTDDPPPPDGPLASFTPPIADGIEVDLDAGASTTAMMTIHNIGDADLDFSFIGFTDREDEPFFFEDFETTPEGQLPPGWSAFGNEYSGGNSPFRVVNNTNLGLGGFSDYRAAPEGEFVEDYLVTPAIDLGSDSSIEFLAARTWSLTWISFYEVLVSTTVPDDPEAFTTIYAFDSNDINHANEGGTVITLDLSDYDLQTVYIAFLHRQNSDSSLFIDDVAVYSDEAPSFVSDVSPASGMVAPGASVDVTVTFDAEGFIEGSYSGNLLIDTNVPATRDFIVYAYPVTMNVTGEAGCVIEPDPIAFGEVIVGFDATMEATVTNEGTADCVLTGAFTSEDDFTVDFDAVTLVPGASADFSVTFAPSSVGTITGTLTLQGDDDVTAGLTGVGLAPPQVAIEPTELFFQMEPDATSSQSVTLSNLAASGAADLEFSVSVAAARSAPDAARQEPIVAGRNAPTAAMTRAQVAAGVPPYEWQAVDPIVAPDPQGDPLDEDWHEGFENIDALPAAGWAMQNNSQPIGTSGWFQGNPGTFPAHAGPPNSYIGANFNNAGGAGDVSNWLMTPEIVLNNGTELRFWTRTTPQFQNFNDRLEVRLSMDGASTDVGSTASSVGDFDELLLSINPDLLPNVYPEVWTEFVITLDQVPFGSTGRFAFRYWVTNSGPNGDFGDFIGIDEVSLTYTGPTMITVSPESGSVEAGASQELTVTIDTEGVDEGTYNFEILIQTNDPDTPVLVVDVQVEVQKVDTEGGTPLVFELSQNYPNPFAQQTTIDFGLAESGPVRIDVYDVAGRRVATLVNGELEAGKHSTVWDANGVASGVYFYRIQAGAFTQTMRALIVR